MVQPAGSSSAERPANEDRCGERTAATDEASADPPDHRPPHPELDLKRLAALVRKAIPAAPDEAARERLESAWVALINTLKQPMVDSDRLRRRFGRLVAELEHLLRGQPGTSGDDLKDDLREQTPPG